jgi:hypothetical protein
MNRLIFRGTPDRRRIPSIKSGMLLIITASLVACREIPHTQPPCKFADNTDGDCFSQLENYTLKTYPSAITRTGNELRITARNGKIVVFTSNPQGEGYEDFHIYFPVGVISNNQFAVVIDGRWEGRDIYLVSLIDGTTHSIDGFPVESPDHQRIAVYSMDLEANYSQNFLAVYKIDGAALAKEILLDGDADSDNLWGPDEVKWLSPSRISFSRTTLSFAEPWYISKPWQLSREGSTWLATPTNQPNHHKD